MNEPTTEDTRIALDVVNGFEREWRVGRRLRIADLLESVPSHARGSLVGLLLRVELELRREQGDTPTVDEYTTELCEWSDLVRSVFDGWSGGERISTVDERRASTEADPMTDPAPPDVLIHRDLKPSNILIDTGNRTAGGRLRPGAQPG